MPKPLRILSVLLLIGGAAAGYWYWSSSDQESAQAELTLFGNVDVRQVELAVNGSERLGEVLAEEGDVVEKGQLLAVLELERFQLAVDRAEALVRTQRQVVAKLREGSRPEEIAKAEAEVDAAEAEVNDLETKYQRNLALLKRNAIAPQDVDDARAALQTAQARKRAFEATHDLVIAGPREEDVAEARALYHRYRVELQQARHELEDASLYAPAHGIIQERILEVGDMATPQRPVYTMALTDPVWVRAYVSEPDLGKIHEGMPAVIQTDSFPDKAYEGWVGFISPTAEFTPKPVETRELRTTLVYQIRVFARNSENELRLGMPATVKISLASP